MASYLTRYLNGDCESVWRELIDFEASAIEPPLLNESMAVAEEIVRRIIHNANIVGRYLQGAGYEFATPGPFVVPANQATAECVRLIEEEFGNLPLILKVWWSHVDRLNHLPTEQLLDSGIGCPTEGISPTGAILINSPAECLEASRQRAIAIAEHVRQAAEAGISGEEEYDVAAPTFILGPITTANDPVGYRLPLSGVDGVCHQLADDEASESLIDWLRFYYLQRGGFGWQFFGFVPRPDGGREFRSFIRPQNEVDSIVDQMELIAF
ncbi:MAG: hypothetical protein KDA85_03865 [Planctomycetaceae bacterium]|nr:hypothetical protein [Planctomycetaceae bacterium]